MKDWPLGGGTYLWEALSRSALTQVSGSSSKGTWNPGPAGGPHSDTLLGLKVGGKFLCHSSYFGSKGLKPQRERPEAQIDSCSLGEGA